MSDISDYLHNIYYDPSHAGAYSSEEKLFRAVKSEGKHDISRAQIKKWLQSQESYAVHKQSRGKIQRRAVIASYQNYQWDVDTAVLETYKKQNDGYAYFVLAIDIFSRVVRTYPLKTKKGIEMVKALEEIFKAAGKVPHYLRSDMGTEYLNSHVKKLFVEKHIKHFVTQNTVKASYSERAIKSIKKRIFRAMTHNRSHRWIDYLQSITKSYNNTYHRTLGKPPNDVTNEDRYRLWNLQRKNANQRAPPTYKFKIGDTVRISHVRNLFRREYDERWTREFFYVTSRFVKDGMCFYTLKDFGNEEISGSFYQSQLLKTNVSNDTEYVVEKIIRRRTRNNQREVLVKWLGWGDKFSSWLPLSQLKDVQQ